MHERQLAIGHLHRRMRFAADLAYALQYFHHPAHTWMVVTQPTTVRIYRQATAARPQSSIGDELASFTLLAESEILECLHYRNGEGVVNRSVIDVCRSNSGLRKCPRTRPACSGERQINPTVVRVFRRLTVPH